MAKSVFSFLVLLTLCNVVQTDNIRQLQTFNSGVPTRYYGCYPLAPDGVYSVHPVDGGRPFQVYCDMTKHGGNWLVIQRNGGGLNFNRTWQEYKEGFGNISMDFWLGNDKISELTNQAAHELLIELTDVNNSTSLAHYSHFRVGTASTFYTLSVGGYSGCAGDGLSDHHGVRFSTPDQDSTGSSCLTSRSGGWWSKNCSGANLNGDSTSVQLQIWKTPRKSVMKIRLAPSHPVIPSTTIPPCTTTTQIPDCREILDEHPGSQSGVYTIDMGDGGPAFPVYCDMTTDGGGWLVFQKRFDGSVDFYKTWNEYIQGFGKLTGEFWLGNENIHRLTAHKTNVLRIDLTDRNNKLAYAKYNTFSIGDSSDLYRLTVSGYSGTAGDSLTRHTRRVFSTKDRDSSSNHCATRYHGAWWYEECHSSNLNGLYNYQGYGQGLDWASWHGYRSSMKETTMKIRPRK